VKIGEIEWLNLFYWESFMKIKSSIKKSVTLIELIVAMVIVGILTVGLTSFINQTIGVWDFLSFRSDIANYGRVSIARMANDIRWISNRASIENATATNLTFTTANGRVGYSYNSAGSQLIYNQGGSVGGAFNSSNMLSTDVTNFAFSYFNSSTSTTTMAVPVSSANLTTIDRIGINATFSINSTVKEGNQNSTVITEIYPRNF
jgi:type II secretory pathway pseudopilin PulG